MIYHLHQLIVTQTNYNGMSCVRSIWRAILSLTVSSYALQLNFSNNQTIPYLFFSLVTLSDVANAHKNKLLPTASSSTSLTYI